MVVVDAAVVLVAAVEVVAGVVVVLDPLFWFGRTNQTSTDVTTTTARELRIAIASSLRSRGGRYTPRRVLGLIASAASR